MILARRGSIDQRIIDRFELPKSMFKVILLILNKQKESMNKTKLLLIMIGMIIVFAGCATLKDKFPLGVDQTAQAFFDDLQRSNNKKAYSLFAKGLSQRVSFDQFDQFMQSIREQWGRIESEETALMPFHERQGENNFIPLNVAPEKIKRYIFDVKFENAEMNFDLTLAPEGNDIKLSGFLSGEAVFI